MDNNKIRIMSKNDLKPKHKCEHEPYEYFKYEVTKPDYENQFRIAIYEIPPQKSNYPYHYHLRNEEVFYIISGEGVLETPDGKIKISAGDTIICPASEKTAHRITNSSHSEMLVYFDCDTINYPDVVGYPNSNKIGIIAKGEQNRFYKDKSTVEYYDGE